MSSSSSSNRPATPKAPVIRRLGAVLGVSLWVFVGFMVAQVALALVIIALDALHVPFRVMNEALLNTLVGAAIYALAIFIVIGMPWLMRKKRTTKVELGLQRLPSWLDFVWLPAGVAAYLILSTVIVTLGTLLLPFIDSSQVQDTGFNGISGGYELMLAFVILVIVAPVAEEILFRGYLFGKLRKHAPLWIAILVTSILFAIVHFQWNVGLDVFALSIILCLLRVATGSIWPSIMLHMLKNGLAFYLLFINPTFLSTLGG